MKPVHPHIQPKHPRQTEIVKEEDGPETGPEIEDEDDPEDLAKRFEGRYFRHPGGMGWEGPDD